MKMYNHLTEYFSVIPFKRKTESWDISECILRFWLKVFEQKLKCRISEVVLNSVYYHLVGPEQRGTFGITREGGPWEFTTIIRVFYFITRLQS